MRLRARDAGPNVSHDIHIYELPRPIWVHVGRVSVDRGIERFLELRLPGSKVVIGDGPDRDRLQREYSHCHFLGYRFGADLATYLAGADVFVYPSSTDAFGLLVLEAIANGLPIAAISGCDSGNGTACPANCVLDDDLAYACEKALALVRRDRSMLADAATGKSEGMRSLVSLARRAIDAADSLGSVSGAHP